MIEEDIFNNTLIKVEQIIFKCILDIASVLDDVDYNNKLKIYSEIKQLAIDGIRDSKQMGVIH
jgi:hypothetical protein